MIAVLAAAAIVVGPTVQVSRSGAERAHEEVFLAAHPTDARRLIGCSIVDRNRYADTGMHVVAYTSEDAGGTWSRAIESSLQLGDPMCGYGPDGSAYFLGINTDDEHWKDAVWWMEIFRSGDGGRTWGAGVRWPAGDRPYLAFGAAGESTAPGVGYLVYSIRARALDKPGPAKTVRDDSVPVLEVLRSADGWKTWRKTAVGVAVGPAFPTASGAVVLSDGALATLWVKRSTKKNDAGEDVGQDPRQELNLTRLEPGSELFGRTVKIADVTADNDYSGTFFSLAGDATHGRFHDRLYAAWADTATPRSRILVSSSADGGGSWTAPRAINAAGETAEGPAARDDYGPTVAVNRDGIVGATWRRRMRNDEDADVWFAFSHDGGASWSEPGLVSSARGPVAEGVARATLGPGDDGTSPTSRVEKYFKGGDTFGLAADADGVFHALWADQRSGIGQVYSATIRVGAPAPPGASR